MASDTVPTSAAAMASERRDMPMPNTVIKDLIRTHCLSRADLVAPGTDPVSWKGGGLPSNYAQFAASQQTNPYPVISPCRNLICPLTAPGARGSFRDSYHTGTRRMVGCVLSSFPCFFFFFCV